jgi:rhodanese-related sulfurtransferase
MLGIAAVAALVVVLLLVWYGSQRNASVNSSQQLLTPKVYFSKYMQPQTPHLLLDVRTPQEFASGHIPGARNIPLQNLAQRLGEVPADQPVIIYCRSGNRSQTAARLLAQAGYTQLYDLGGIMQWQAQGLPVQ